MDEVTTPVTSPKITIGGKEYELRFRLSDVIKLWKDHQIDISKRVEGAEAFARVPYLLAAAIAHSGNGLTADQIAEAIDLGEMPIYLEQLIAAQKKATPAALAAAARMKTEADKANDVTVQ